MVKGHGNHFFDDVPERLGTHGNLGDSEDDQPVGYSYPPMKGNAQDVLESCMKKFESRQYYRVSRNEVYTWFKDMGFRIAEGGSFTVHNVQGAIWMYFEDPDTCEHLQSILDQADASGDGICDIDEFHQALRLGYSSLAVKKIVRGAEIPEPNNLYVTRQRLVGFFEHKTQLVGSCSSLPYSILVFFFLFMMVLYHLNTSMVYFMSGSVRHAVDEWLDVVGDWNNDIENNYVDWLGSQVIDSFNLAGDHPQRGRFMNTFQLTSGIKVMKFETEPIECAFPQWDKHYQSVTVVNAGTTTTAWPTAMCQSDDHLDPYSRDKLTFEDANVMVLSPMKTDTELKAIVAAKQAEDPPWITNRNALGIRINASMFNAQENYFLNILLVVARSRVGGPIETVLRVEAYKPDPYIDNRGTMYFLDAMWMLLVLYSFINEMAILAHDLTVHWPIKALYRYLDMWTVIEWYNFVMSTMLITTYYDILQNSKALRNGLNVNIELLANDSIAANDRIAQANVNDLENTNTGMKVAAGYVNFKSWLCFYCVSAALVFFKGFRANPKLDVVYQTLARASPDLVHFGLVFITVLLSFTLTGHVCYGHDCGAFAEWSEALSTEMFFCFGMYVDSYRDDMILSNNESPLGVIMLMLIITFIIILMMNMILAIIFDIYGDVKAETGDAASIFDQLMHEIGTRKKRFKAMQKKALAAGGSGAAAQTKALQFGAGWVGFVMHELHVLFDFVKNKIKWIIHFIGNILHYIVIWFPGGRRLSEATEKFVHGLEDAVDRLEETLEKGAQKLDEAQRLALKKAEEQAQLRVEAGKKQRELERKMAKMNEAQLKAAGLWEGFDPEKDKGNATDPFSLLTEGTGLGTLINAADAGVNAANRSIDQAADAVNDAVDDVADAVDDAAHLRIPDGDDNDEPREKGEGWMTRTKERPEEEAIVEVEPDLSMYDVDGNVNGSEKISAESKDSAVSNASLNSKGKRKKKWTTDRILFAMREHEAHPGNLVTAESLVEAFRDLHDDMAEYIVSECDEYTRAEKMLADLNLEDMLRVVTRCDSNLREAKHDYVYTTRRADAFAMTQRDRTKVMEETNDEMKRITKKVRKLVTAL